ncbi:MAG: radical SAM protein [Lachnospiraceae bacterium]|nr:radical SAM protein [Lachnospiraceae bacterium]
MKWTKKSHEFDETADRLQTAFYRKKKQLYIFGAGLIGERLEWVFKKTGCFAGYLDNDTEKQKTGVNGERVLSLSQYMESGEDGWLILAAGEKNMPLIERQVLEAGLKRESDFYLYQEFMERFFPILAVYEYDRLWIDLVQISLTERCSLKCRKCAHACYAVESTRSDMSLETVKQSVDCFFKKVDMVGEFVLIGGEPFLYADMSAAIAYIGETYRDRIRIFSITTNGTIVPQQEVLDACRKYKVHIRVSDYSAALGRLEKQYIRLRESLDQNKISYVFGDKERQWFDYGFERGSRKRQEEELIEVLDRCKTPCREIRGNRYYFCVMARSVSENLQLKVGEDEYLDLDQPENDDKKTLLEFQMGYSEKGYLAMCDFCSGAEAVKALIPAAEQWEEDTDRREQ